MRHADDLQAVSVDEALIDVSSAVARLRSASPLSADDFAVTLAQAIRAQVKQATGCEGRHILSRDSALLIVLVVSIGIAENIQLARLATRRAKPAGLFHLKHEDLQQVLKPLDIDDLHGFGHSTRQKAREKLGATNLGELMMLSKAQLCEALGKGMGETLYKAIRGIDDRKLESDKPRKSVSCDINVGFLLLDSCGVPAMLRICSMVSDLRTTSKRKSLCIVWQRKFPDAWTVSLCVVACCRSRF